MDYSAVSKDLTSKLSKSVKQNNGIYFTPPSCIKRNIILLEPYINDSINILEPSCGSGEYITALHNRFPNTNIRGIEYNETIYQCISHLNNDKIAIFNIDYLKYETNTKYDLIIGNPPYYVMKKSEVDKYYHPYFEGRPNIFILFIIKSIQLLNDNGILSFVLPKNFLNCLYYDKTRKYIVVHFQILHIIDCDNDKYIDTQQDTIILIIQKSLNADNNRFILENNSYTIFTNEENKQKMVSLYENSSSLLDLGFKVSVGNIIWNQCKDILTNDDSKTRLIYSSDIVNNTLTQKKYKNVDKHNFIYKSGINRPMIVINRGYGVGEYKFNYCLLNESFDYLIENHLICIEYTHDLSHDKLIDIYNKIIRSLNNKKTAEFIGLYFGNNAINTTELNCILPIFQDI